MSNPLTDLLLLYRDAIRQTGQSIQRGWIIMVAVVGFGVLFLLALQIAAPLGIAGGFILGAVNALLVGATLSLIEQSLPHARTLTIQDIFDSFGQYFWDVIGVGFVLWLPLMTLEMGIQANPYGLFFSYAVFLLIFILLNPAPEVIYQIQHDSPLEILKTCYDFVLEHWIEWFLPLVVILVPVLASPRGMSAMLDVSRTVGRGGGLNFVQFLMLPLTVLDGWITSLGVPSSITWPLTLLLTPPLAVALLLFRGHLFASLSRVSRRQYPFTTR
ncbi:MAG TPA: hypothetical protein VH681_07460 [Nitrospiraceae bacterium]|jgi:hypothetical protein